MEANEIATQLQQYVAETVLGGDDSELDQDTPLLAWGLLDSLALLQLLTHIEKVFHVRIDEEEVTPGHFATIRAITALVADYLAKDEPATSTETGLSTQELRELEAFGIAARLITLQDGVEVNALEVGQAPQFVFLPAPGHDTTSWKLVLRAWEGLHSALALGLASYSPGAPGFETQCDIMQTVLDQTVSSPIVLVGHDLGALIAAEVARRQPHRVRTLVVLALGQADDPNHWWHQRLHLAQDPNHYWETALHRQPTNAYYFQQCLQKTASHPAFLGFDDHAAREAMQKGLTGLAIPVLFISGHEDRISPLGVVNEAAARVPGSEVKRLARCGHFPQLEQPEELISILEEIWSGLERP